MARIRPQINDLRRPNRGVESTEQLDGTRDGAVVSIYDRSVAVQLLGKRSDAQKGRLANGDIYAVIIWEDHLVATPRSASSDSRQ